jgi:carbon storage regulator CsrA
MLVLSRQEFDKIVLPSLGIEITVLDIRRRRVRIGITASPDVPIFRREILDELAHEQQTELAAGKEAVA